jgi:hypothetical protein
VIGEVVEDKGYHSRTTVHDLATLEIRTYISEPDRGRQSWTAQEAERNAVYANRRRVRGDRGNCRHSAGLPGPQIGARRNDHFLCAFMDDAKTAIWAPRRDHTPSDRLSLGFLVAASVP